MRWELEIVPMCNPHLRADIEKVLERHGYTVVATGQDRYKVHPSHSFITFERDDPRDGNDDDKKG